MNKCSEGQEGPEERGRGGPVSGAAGREGDPICLLSERMQVLSLRPSPPLGVSDVCVLTV